MGPAIDDGFVEARIILTVLSSPAALPVRHIVSKQDRGGYQPMLRSFDTANGAIRNCAPFLCSDLFDWQLANKAEAAVTMASDAGSGTILSMIRTMVDAYRLQVMTGQRLTPLNALYSAGSVLRRRLGCPTRSVASSRANWPATAI
jgi:hypothetical protein